jgi:monoamine oxidase
MAAHGTRIAIVGGGLSGMIAARELLRMGFQPVIYEADQIGGRMRSVGPSRATRAPRVSWPRWARCAFPPSSTTLFHYLDAMGLSTTEFPNPLSEAAPSTVVDLKGETHYARTLDDLPAVYREVSEAWQQTLEQYADLVPLQDAIRSRDTKKLKAIWNGLVNGSTTRPSTGSSLAARRSRASACARSSARSASAPVAGTPTTRTRSSRSFASS